MLVHQMYIYMYQYLMHIITGAIMSILSELEKRDICMPLHLYYMWSKQVIEVLKKLYIMYTVKIFHC